MLKQVAIRQFSFENPWSTQCGFGTFLSFWFYVKSFFFTFGVSQPLILTVLRKCQDSSIIKSGNTKGQFLTFGIHYWFHEKSKWQKNAWISALCGYSYFFLTLVALVSLDEHLTFAIVACIRYWPISNMVISENPIHNPKIPPRLATNQMIGTFWSLLILVTTASLI